MTGTGESAIERVRRAARPPVRRRSYKQARAAKTKGGFQVLLDARPLLTPGKAALLVPTQALAEAIAAEWEAQRAHIDPAALPLTRLAFTVIDRVAGAREGVIDAIVAYAGSDLLCYRAEEPDKLVARQRHVWDPILAWAAAEHGLHLVTGTGVMPRTQTREALDIFRQHIENDSDFVLGALADMTRLTGSALLALAVLRGPLSAEQAWAAAHVEEDWQIGRWGEDEEAKLRRARRWRDMRAAARMAAMVASTR